MQLKDKIVYLFNKFYSSFLKDIKESHEDLRKIVKTNYKVIDKKSAEYCEAFSGNFHEYVKEVAHGNMESIQEKEVCNGITVATAISKMSASDANIFWNYVYILLTFAYMYKLEEDEALFENVVKILGMIQHKSENVESEIQDILDDEIRELLMRAYKTGMDIETIKVDVPPPSSDDGAFPDIFAGLANSKIANLAKEISKDIDISSLKSDNPQDMIKNLLDFSGSNNVLNNIIQKVSSTLGNKMSSGEIKQEELLGEAMSMMSLMNAGNNPLMAQFANNPLFAQMMKGMKSGNVQPRQDVLRKASTRDRLKKKLDERKKNME